MIIIKNDKKWKAIIAFLIGLLFLFGLTYSLYQIIIWQIDSGRTNEQIIAVRKMVKKSKIDFDKLKNINSDTKGWIEVRGTDISYPFVQANNNEYYLSHSFDKTVNQAGWVFLDYRNNIDDIDQNTIIYAHARIDGTMFGSMKNILNNNWYSKKENHIIKLSSDKYETKWEVFSVYHIKTTDDYLQTTFNDSMQYKSFLDLINNRSMYIFDKPADENDKILTLSTCYNENEKIVLHAKLSN